MRVLLIGNGGREHALAWKLSQSPRLDELLIAPGNPGTAQHGRNLPIGAEDVGGLVEAARRERVELVVVGPEAALAAGIVDALHKAEIACFGPTQAATTIESSKAFAKSVMEQAGIPTAGHRVFHSAVEALQFLADEEWSRWRVAKADGLHAGKGVVVAESRAELESAVRSLGAAGEPLVLEEPLEGVEISLLAFSDGERVVVMPPAQDHKRIGEGDRGPNTGGMGAYAPVPLDISIESLQRSVVEPAIAALGKRGTPFVGVLFVGLMLTSDGPRVLEYNARWGDPETQVLVPLLDADLLEIMTDCVQGRLQAESVRWHAGAALGVVLASAGYPQAPRRGDAIRLPPVAGGVQIFQAGTALRDGRLETAGGRVLTVVGRGATLLEARERAYAAAEMIDFEGKQLRRDIGWHGLQARADGR